MAPLGNRGRRIAANISPTRKCIVCEPSTAWKSSSDASQAPMLISTPSGQLVRSDVPSRRRPNPLGANPRLRSKEPDEPEDPESEEESELSDESEWDDTDLPLGRRSCRGFDLSLGLLLFRF